MDWYR